MYYTFLDHAVTRLKTRFLPELKRALPATYLLPCNVSNITSLSDEMLYKLKDEFQAFLPDPSSFTSEVSTWKVHMVEADDDKRDLLSMFSFTYSN